MKISKRKTTCYTQGNSPTDYQQIFQQKLCRPEESSMIYFKLWNKKIPSRILYSANVVGLSLLIFCWEFLHLYSKILVCNQLFWRYLCLVLVLGWWWLHRMNLGVCLSSIFWKSLRRLSISSSLYVW